MADKHINIICSNCTHEKDIVGESDPDFDGVAIEQWCEYCEEDTMWVLDD